MINKYTLGKGQFLLAKILKKTPIPHIVKEKYNCYRHKKIEKFLLPYLQEAQKRVSTQELSSNDGPIWILWWQGIDQMPLLVRNCIQSVKNNCGSRKVILITKKNLDQYFTPSERIKQLKKVNKIPMAHFSDVIRFNLLKEYGGLWLDATIFVTHKLSSDYFSQFFTCSGYPDEDYFFVTEGNWCSFLMGGSPNHPVFQFMSAFYDLYWKDNDELIDYFIIDYALKYAWKNNLGDFKVFTHNNFKKYNPCLFNLMPLLNRPFNKRTWEKISKNTDLYKLTYKVKLSQKRNTYYNKIINSED
ncbi:capsular polysaccharide synthesis protein [Lactobacillus intestinalis]|uniref:capsular polysaccharide synthesis protein n=1 Tax=Lactobacillus intestinalis TaxID=151781 RepID=UPI001F5888B6|nr:capsular polysaccharide synthesis protein [Lactobacillus intestinalis]